MCRTHSDEQRNTQHCNRQWQLIYNTTCLSRLFLSGCHTLGLWRDAWLTSLSLQRLATNNWLAIPSCGQRHTVSLSSPVVVRVDSSMHVMHLTSDTEWVYMHVNSLALCNYSKIKGNHQYTPWVKKGDTILLSISLLNIDRFSQFFHQRTQLEILQ